MAKSITSTVVAGLLSSAALRSQTRACRRLELEKNEGIRIDRKQTILFPLLLLTACICPAQSRNAGLSPGLRGHQPLSGPSLAPTQAPDNVPAASTTYAFTLINFPGASSTTPQGMNPSASASQQIVVGAYYPASGDNENGFLLGVAANSEGVIRETFKTSDIPGSTLQIACGVNDSGQIVGSYLDASSVWHGYELSGGVYTTIDVPFAGATFTNAYGINNAGAIVGAWSNASGTFGFELSGGTYTSLQVPGETTTYPQNLNEKNQIVGYYEDSSGIIHGFFYQGGKYTTIDVPGASSTEAETINDEGAIVGDYCAASGCASFLLSKGVFSTIAVPGAAGTAAYEISTYGVISGAYGDSAGITHGFIAIPQ